LQTSRTWSTCGVANSVLSRWTGIAVAETARPSDRTAAASAVLTCCIFGTSGQAFPYKIKILADGIGSSGQVSRSDPVPAVLRTF